MDQAVSLSSPLSGALPVAQPARPSGARFLLIWAILVGGLVVGAATSGALSRGTWFALMAFVYLGPFKIAALLGLTGEERRQLTWRRLLAFFLWVGMQPRRFLPSYVLPPTEPRATWRGALINVLSGAVLLWGVPWLLPSSTPLLVRAWVGLVGFGLLRLFGGFDVLALIFYRLGFGVEKAWVNPAASTSLRDFWGRRWNRFMSGMLRDLLFTPLARHVGVVLAALTVFVYSGVVHEFVSVLARGGSGGPTLYFLIQGGAFLFEGTRFGRRYLVRSSRVGWCWTVLVVVGPVALVVPPAFLQDVIVPILSEMGVPGLSS
jgi:hypothetical protein